MFKDEQSPDNYTNIVNSDNIKNLLKSFIETLNHDLKTPVIAQIRALELVLNNNFGKLNKEQTEMLKLTLDSCKCMYEMVSTLISTYKFDSEEFELNYSYFNIMQILEEGLKKIKSFVEEKNIKVVVIPEIKNPLVAGDEIRLKKVINTLLLDTTNSAFKNSIMKIYITDENKTIAVRTETHGGYLSPEKLESLFRINYGSLHKYNRIGEGIGLYLVKKIIEKHNGRIIAQSSLTQKNVIGFEIPIDLPKSEQVLIKNCV